MRYRFEVPAGAVALAASGRRRRRFASAARAWGVQFHPEVRRDQVLAWFARRARLPRPLDELAAELDEKLAGWQEHGRALCRAFLAAATGTESSVSSGRSSWRDHSCHEPT